jgi:apolipoprotein N-acyltransferase
VLLVHVLVLLLVLNVPPEAFPNVMPPMTLTVMYVLIFNRLTFLPVQSIFISSFTIILTFVISLFGWVAEQILTGSHSAMDYLTCVLQPI